MMSVRQILAAMLQKVCSSDQGLKAGHFTPMMNSAILEKCSKSSSVLAKIRHNAGKFL